MIRNYRSQLPFGDDVLEQIRKDVLTKIEREHRVERRWLGVFLRATLAASVLVFLVSLPLLRRSDPKTPVASDELRVTHAVSPMPQTPSQLATHNSQPVPPVTTPLRPWPRRHPIERIEPASAEPEVVRIELHTSDPDVRIIWFTNPSGETR